MVNDKTVNCEQVWREVSNYIDGEVNPELRSAMDEHFRTCQRCASVLAGTRNVVTLYGDERMLEVPAGFSRRLERRLAKTVPVGIRRWPTWSTWLVPIAAMALIAGAIRLANTFSFRHPVKSPLALPANHIPPDMVVVVSSGSKLFHVPGCKFIHDKDSERTLTASEAVREGYAPCSRCLRQYLKTSNRYHDDDEDADADTDPQEPQAKVLGAIGN